MLTNVKTQKGIFWQPFWILDFEFQEFENLEKW